MKAKIKHLIVLGVSFLLLFLLSASVVMTSISNLIKKMALVRGYTEEMRETAIGGLSISDEVEAYRTIITEYAKEYGIEDYVDLLLAVVMQESGGFGNDIFQASESLGLKPGTLSVEESVNQGVKVMAARLEAAGTEAVTDIDKIKLALQGYNFGGGYITYASNRDGQWTQDNTNDYAKIQSGNKKRSGEKAKNLGIWAYGDQYYTFHVLRYYTATFTAEGNGEVVQAAIQCLGSPYVWGATGPDKFDCSGLVYYCYRQSGKYTGARLTAAGYKNIATSITEEETVPGDLVFFTRNGVTHHVGIYIGNGQMIHAPHQGDVVRYGSIERKTEIVTFGRLANTIWRDTESDEEAEE